MSTPEEVEDQVRNGPVLEFALVGLGGALGALARWGTAQLVTSGPAGFPLASLIVNLVGCGLIGVAAVTIGRTLDRRRTRAEWWFAVSGVLGGFTTFSSFAVESERLLASGRIVTAAAYVALTIGGGLIATEVGRRGTTRRIDPELGR